MKIICNQCSKVFNPIFPICPYCGHKYTRNEINKMKASLIKELILFCLIAIIAIVYFSSDSGSLSDTSKSSHDSIEGTYSYSDSSIRLSISIYGNSWTGEFTIVTGFGSDYDGQNTEYESGEVQGNDLYDGYIRIGYVSGESLHTSLGGKRVVLRK